MLFRSSHSRQEIAALFEELHAGLGYWLFNRHASDRDLPDILSKSSQLSEPGNETIFETATENSLDYLIRYVIFSDNEGRKKFDQFTTAIQENQKLKGFTNELMDMIRFYIENS